MWSYGSLETKEDEIAFAKQLVKIKFITSFQGLLSFLLKAVHTLSRPNPNLVWTMIYKPTVSVTNKFCYLAESIMVFRKSSQKRMIAIWGFQFHQTTEQSPSSRSRHYQNRDRCYAQRPICRFQQCIVRQGETNGMCKTGTERKGGLQLHSHPEWFLEPKR